MLNHEQLRAVMNTNDYIVLSGDFGTGKTFVLKERAKRCAEKNTTSNIAYINLTSLDFETIRPENLSNLSLMDIVARKDFERYDNITTITCMELEDHYSKYRHDIKSDEKSIIFSLLDNYLKHNKFDFVFIDELSTYISKSAPDFFQQAKGFCVTVRKPVYGKRHDSEGIVKH